MFFTGGQRASGLGAYFGGGDAVTGVALREPPPALGPASAARAQRLGWLPLLAAPAPPPALGPASALPGPASALGPASAARAQWLGWMPAGGGGAGATAGAAGPASALGPAPAARAQ
jgi:hypothetical protein